MFFISQVETSNEVETIRSLFKEYQSLLGIDLGFQGFEQELQNIPGEYAPPGGRLLLAINDGKPVGCVALREFHGKQCEMKRLYIRQSARGLGIGKALVSRIIDEARLIGYKEIILDTLPSMIEAQNLYYSFGFHEIPPYRPNPVPGARYLGKIL